MNAKPKTKIDWGAVAISSLGIGAIVVSGTLLARKQKVTCDDAEAFARLVATVLKQVTLIETPGAPSRGESSTKSPTPARQAVDEVADACAVLGVDREATADEIRSAFRAQLLKVHPDHGGDAEATRLLIAARDALLKRVKETVS